MTLKTTIVGTFAALTLMASSGLATAGSALEQALADGAKRLTAEQIAERFVGKTGTWVSASGDRKMLIYYGKDNDLHATPVGGDGKATGYYGITNTDRICVSWEGRDEGRLRCLDVLLVDGTVTKFNADGSLNGTYAEFAEGNAV